MKINILKICIFSVYIAVLLIGCNKKSLEPQETDNKQVSIQTYIETHMSELNLNDHIPFVEVNEDTQGNSYYVTTQNNYEFLYIFAQTPSGGWEVKDKKDLGNANEISNKLSLVKTFYDYLQNNRFKDAFQLLSPSMQAQIQAPEKLIDYRIDGFSGITYEPWVSIDDLMYIVCNSENDKGSGKKALFYKFLVKGDGIKLDQISGSP